MGKLTDKITEVIQLALYGEQAESPVPFIEPAHPAAAPTEDKTEKFIVSDVTVSVFEMGGGISMQADKKNLVSTLRNYAKNSTWVRAAIDYHRRMIGRAEWELVPIDTTIKQRRNDKFVRAEVEKLLKRPNEAEESYGFLKEQFVEDYLVVGHGCFFLELYNDLTVRGIQILDAGKIGFMKNWDGTKRDIPRYVEFKDINSPLVKRRMAHEQVFCLVNRKMSNSNLGFSHVEALHKTVIALLSGDEYMLQERTKPMPDTAISLGEGVTQPQADAFKHQLRTTKDKLAVVAGVKKFDVKRLTATSDEMKILDGQEWFVRQVAAVFGISTAKLKLSMDLSRANGETMSDDDLEAIEGDLTRLRELENAVFIDRYSYLGDINLEFSYPIMHRKDETMQARIAKLQSGNQPWTSINESRTRTGEKPLDENKYPYANEPIIQTKDGPMPMSVWQKMIQEAEKNIGKEPAIDPAESEPSADVQNVEKTADEANAEQ